MCSEQDWPGECQKQISNCQGELIWSTEVKFIPRDEKMVFCTNKSPLGRQPTSHKRLKLCQISATLRWRLDHGFTAKSVVRRRSVYDEWQTSSNMPKYAFPTVTNMYYYPFAIGLLCNGKFYGSRGDRPAKSCLKTVDWFRNVWKSCTPAWFWSSSPFLS